MDFFYSLADDLREFALFYVSAVYFSDEQDRKKILNLIFLEMLQENVEYQLGA